MPPCHFCSLELFDECALHAVLTLCNHGILLRKRRLHAGEPFSSSRQLQLSCGIPLTCTEMIGIPYWWNKFDMGEMDDSEKWAKRGDIASQLEVTASEHASLRKQFVFLLIHALEVSVKSVGGSEFCFCFHKHFLAGKSQWSRLLMGSISWKNQWQNGFASLCSTSLKYKCCESEQGPRLYMVWIRLPPASLQLNRGINSPRHSIWQASLTLNFLKEKKKTTWLIFGHSA